MAGPPEYLESNQSLVPALTVYNHAAGTARLIEGYGAGVNNLTFLVYSDGSIWSKHNYETAGGIIARGAAEIKGNLWVGRDAMVTGRVFALEFKVRCDKNAKENFSSVNPIEILDKLASMPIQSWNFKEESTNERHIGPTAQDFQAAFGLNGDNDTRISSIDLHGVALAAIQGLNKKLRVENDELHAKLASLEERLSALESKRETE
ncbi:tail fiber domain-containing protein [Bacillus atrophaeus]|uniref:tail fiber domain-containing protein n=1 Tax=Bacillus atrophaeus TaxID=1452 RepID=UPI00227EE40E|nr:tail fiber domain-containing protein [Bacillus atrophaeus]MCY8464364.1 tail fiber domain-containing protein [Bacillus atrophaeus]MCY8475817.1 tail fiber domain-containing protein [Bacillus atrophaeus]